MAILHDSSINVGRLISENIETMEDAPQHSCGHFCIINELCRLTRVESQGDDDL